MAGFASEYEKATSPASLRPDERKFTEVTVEPNKGSPIAITLSVTGSGPVKMPRPPASSSALNATVPASLIDGTLNTLYAPLLSATVSVAGSGPMKTPPPPTSSEATNATVPASLMETSSPNPAKGPLLSAIVSVDGSDPRKIPRPAAGLGEVGHLPEVVDVGGAGTEAIDHAGVVGEHYVSDEDAGDAGVETRLKDRRVAVVHRGAPNVENFPVRSKMVSVACSVLIEIAEPPVGGSSSPMYNTEPLSLITVWPRNTA